MPRITSADALGETTTEISIVICGPVPPGQVDGENNVLFKIISLQKSRPIQ